jgi:hypothetical protein
MMDSRIGKRNTTTLRKLPTDMPTSSTRAMRGQTLGIGPTPVAIQTPSPLVPVGGPLATYQAGCGDAV